MRNPFSSRRRSTNAIARLGDTSVPRSIHGQMVENISEADGLHRLQSTNSLNFRTGGLSYVELTSRERSIISANDAESVDLLFNLVKGQRLGGMYNSAFCELCDGIEVVFLGRLYICNAFRAERRDAETINIVQNEMRTFHELLHNTAVFFKLYGPGGKPMSDKKTEIRLQELRSEVEAYMKMLTMVVGKLDPAFVRVLDHLTNETFGKSDPSTKLVLEYIIGIVRERHPGLRSSRSRNAVLDGDFVAEPEGRESTLPPAVPTSAIQPGHVTQIMDGQLFEEPHRRQSSIQRSPTTPTATSPRSNSHYSPSKVGAANGGASSQYLARNEHSASQTRHTVNDTGYHSGASRNPQTSKTAPPRNYPTEDPPQRRSTRNGDVLEETRAEKPSTRRSSRKGTYSEDRDEYPSERRRESAGDRPHRSSSGTASAQPPRRTTRWESPIKEEAESANEQSSSEDDKSRRRHKKTYTADSERRRRPADRGRASESSYNSQSPYDAFSLPNLNLGLGAFDDVTRVHQSSSGRQYR